MTLFPGKESKEQKVEQILLKNYNHYYRLAYSYVNNEADAGDIVQNGAYKAILNSDSLKNEEYAATWIYRIMLNEIFRFYVNNEADAGDIVQNGAYKAILNSDSLKNEEYAATWIYRIMLNEIFRFLKKDKPFSYDELDVELSTEDVYENVDLRRALDTMSKEDKAVIELKYFEDMKFSEIAEILGENVSTVKSRLYRGLRKLKVELTDA